MEFTLSKNGFTATVTTMGGELISFKNDEREYLWDGNPEFWPGHAPILFPFVSALNNSEVMIDGKLCHFNDKHGFGRKFEYTVKERTEDSVTFSLTENEVTLAQYPYAFEAQIIHKLTDNGFETTYKVINTDSKCIKFAIGGHPALSLMRIFPTTPSYLIRKRMHNSIIPTRTVISLTIISAQRR